MPTTEFKHYEDTDTFDRLYQQELSRSDRNRDAYRKVEERFKQRFGKRRYSSFESFKVSYSIRRKS